MTPNSTERGALDWFEAQFGAGISELGGPIVSHCVGSGLLFGSSYLTCLADWTTATACSSNDLICGTIVLRAAVVLDDFRRDEASGDQAGFAAELVEELLRAARERIHRHTRCDDFARALLEEAREKSENAYDRLEHGFPPCFDLIVDKCAFAFVPLKIIEREDTSFPRRFLERVLARYLLALQLVDDLQDAAVDICSPCNHNLFIWGLRPEICDQLLRGRERLAPFVSAYIARFLRTTSRAAVRAHGAPNSVAEVLLRSVSYLSPWMRGRAGHETLWCPTARPENYIVPAREEKHAAVILERAETLGSSKPLTGYEASLMQRFASAAIGSGELSATCVQQKNHAPASQPPNNRTY